MKHRLLLALAASTVLSIGSAGAQTTPQFRVPMGNSATSGTVASNYAWLQSVGVCSTTCGTGTRSTSYQCQDVSQYDYTGGTGYGAPEASSLCTAAVGPQPATTSASCTVYSGCSYTWVKPPVTQTPIPYQGNPVGRVGCGYVNSVFAPYCQRNGNPAVTMSSNDYAFCQGDTANYADVAANKAGALGYNTNAAQTNAPCNTTDHNWVPNDTTSGWGSWTSTCSASATRTRTVQCYRKFDNSLQPDANCDPTAKPATTQTQPVYSGCTYAWSTGAWGASSNTCSSAATQTRSVVCQRSDGTTVADANCTATKPSSTQTVPDYSSCTYAWQSGPWSASANTCSSSTTQTRTNTCQRSDGTTVANSNCTGAQPATSQTVSDYSGCTYQWVSGAWGSSSNTCSSAATQTRSVVCQRSDGTTSPDSSCTGTKPQSSQTVPDYSGCTYSWQNGAWGPSANTCSSSTTQNRSVWCQRSDGTTVGNSNCSGAAPASSQTVSDYSGCGYSWVTGAWGASANTCSSNTTQTRSVVCQQSNGTTVADSQCSGAKPSSSQNVSDYSSCTYSWQAGAWGASANTCSSNTTQTRSVWCQRSNGDTVANANCSGAAPAGSQNVSDYSGCTYSWQSGAWGSPSSNCSSSATETRAVQCVRSDSTGVADSYCSGAKPQSSQQVGSYSGCTYSSSKAVTSSCSGGQQSVAYTCTRSDNVQVPNSNCGTADTGTQACTAHLNTCTSDMNLHSCSGSTIGTYDTENGSGIYANNPSYNYSHGDTRLMNSDYCASIGGTCYISYTDRTNNYGQDPTEEDTYTCATGTPYVSGQDVTGNFEQSNDTACTQ